MNDTQTRWGYVATTNTPGYLPMDDEPPIFATANEAWRYHVEAVERSWDEYPEDENGAAVDAHTQLHNLDQSQEGTIYAPTPGYEGDHDLGIAYSVTRVAVQECSNCGRLEQTEDSEPDQRWLCAECV